MKKIFYMLAAVAVVATGSVKTVEAQSREQKVVISGGVDLISSYVWRGVYQAGVSLQPGMTMSVGNFSLTAWGSTDFSASDYKEMDMTMTYALGPVTFSLADYYWTGASNEWMRPNRNYFHFGYDSPHKVELGVAWRITEKVPITLSWNTMLFGGDRKDDGSQNYSTYAEISYPFSAGPVDMNAGVGMTPWATKNMYGTTGFAVTNVFVGARKMWSVQKQGSIQAGIFTNLIWNPSTEDVNFVGGLSFKF